MSLQVWLPLTKDLRQQGLDGASVTNSGATYSSTGGKLGGCYSFSSSSSAKLINTLTTSVTSAIGSLACWVKFNSFPTSSTWFNLMQVGSLGGFANCRLGLYMEYTDKINISINGSTTGNNTYTHSLSTNTWYHICATYDGTLAKLYINGTEVMSKTATVGSYTTAAPYVYVGGTSSYYLNGYINDARYYNHCLSAQEIKRISQGLVLHYPLNHMGLGQENLFKSTQMTASERSGFVSNSSTDWTKYFRYYNGAAGLHSFSDDIDTISLNGSGNLGICFVRSATDISLDSTSNYIISCEAKCTKAGAHLDIGLSYYNNSNTWVWRGGTNAQNFNATNTWQKFTLTFKPDADTQYICYCFTVIGASGSTDTWSIRHCKLEKGSIATPWSPAPSDSSYIEMGLNTDIEYDTSGFCNNGTRAGTFTWSSDTPKYQASIYMPTAATISHSRCLDNISQEWTCAAWVKPDVAGNYQNLNNFNSNNRLYHGTYPLLYLNSGTNDYYRYGNKAIPANEWTHICFVFKNSTGQRDVYINGVLQNGSGPNQTSTPSGLPDSIIIGGSYAGYMCDYREYATALSADDVKSLYQNCATIDSNGTIHGQIRT